MKFDVLAALFSLTGAFLIANKIWYGFLIAIISNICWIAFGNQINSKALQIECIIYFIINLYGIYFWTL